MKKIIKFLWNKKALKKFMDVNERRKMGNEVSGSTKSCLTSMTNENTVKTLKIQALGGCDQDREIMKGVNFSK